MKKLIYFIFALLTGSAFSQTFPVQNLQVNGTSHFTGAVSGAGMVPYSQTVATVAALRTYSHNAGNNVTTLGYSAAADGGAASYTLLSATTGAFVDNGCNIIVASDGAVWGIPGNRINVLQCGADKSGVASSSTAFQNAINAGLTYDYVDVPPGTYLLSTTVNINNANGVWLHGNNATITSSTVMFTHTAAVSNFTVDGLTFAGTGSAFKNTNQGLYANGWTVYNCLFARSLSDSLYETFIDSKIENNFFGAPNGTVGAQNRHIYAAGQAASGTAVNNNLYKGNRFNNAVGGGSAIFIQYGSNNTFIANDIEANSVPAMIVDGGGITNIYGNWFESNTGASQMQFLNSGAITNTIYYNRAINFNGNVVNMLVAGNAFLFNLDANSLTLSMEGNSLYTNQAGVNVTTTAAGSNRGAVRFLNNSNYSSSFTLTNLDGLQTVAAGFDGFNVVSSSAGATLLSVGDTGQISTGAAANSPFNSTTATAPNMVVLSNGVLQRSTFVAAPTSTATALVTSSVTMANGAGSSAGTLTTAPSAGNPTKWIPILDNGVTRYIPAW